MMALVKSICFVILCLCQSQLFASEVILEKNNTSSEIKTKIKIKTKTKIKKVNVSVISPSKYYSPEFYNHNELKEVFDAYANVRRKIEKPLEIKKVDETQGTEISLATHFDGGKESSSFNDFKFRIEFQAKFL